MIRMQHMGTNQAHYRTCNIPAEKGNSVAYAHFLYPCWKRLRSVGSNKSQCTIRTG